MKRLIYAFLATGIICVSIVALNFEAKADQHCYGPCVREILDCPDGGTKCAGSGASCGAKQGCKGGNIE